MVHKDMATGHKLLEAMADAYPQPVHFGYLGLALGISPGAMLRALRQLRDAGLIEVDRGLAARDLPYAQPRITGKGIAVLSGLESTPLEAADTLRRLDASTLSQLLQKRGRGMASALETAEPSLDRVGA